MSKILFINPSKWGRGITPIWIPSHAAVLKNQGHSVELFDSTFYENWTDNEIKFNTNNLQYKKSDYENIIKFKKNNIFDDLQKKLNDYQPDIVFWSALSSHIHGEGEYVNFQYGYDLLKKVITKAKKITAGLQVTANPKKILSHFKSIDYLIRGESEFVLCEVANKINNSDELKKIPGLVYRKGEEINFNCKQKIIKNMDEIPNYDYSLFEDQIFLRPYNGKILRAIDYEMSRGCVFTCSYCVETIIQKYYEADSSKRGVLLNPKKYLRNKSAKRIFDEISFLNKEFHIELFRCQDTNFLTIDRKVLEELSELIDNSNLQIILYIETRSEGINEYTVKLLKKLKVDGIGMGLEVSTEGFRENSLNRFASQSKIIKTYELLKNNNIKRTAYNIIGLPNQTEDMIKDTIKFNAFLKPDNVTVAYYSPYYGTLEQQKSNDLGDFDDYEFDVDGQIRTLSKSKNISAEKLNYYKKNFVHLVKNPSLL